ncbi:ribonuclease D [Neptunicella sp. SCSIO 80796]|uniref:ribonuclease D n=1 Tax=Neptunicella plasticusilytica TaxID=3117012 RepID=UPI003A4E557D
MYEYLDNNAQVAEFCQQALHKKAIAVDTEFVRTRTLYPQLGLIQIYDGERLVLIDPVAVTDLSPLVTLLIAPDVVKILHSCSEDLETFQTALNIMPEPVFDTQFAASIVNIGPMLGYAKLVEIMLDIQVDKGESRTDWLARPLSPQQLEYAANDVLYLYQLYPQLKQQVEDKQRLDWVFEEIRLLAIKKQRSLPVSLTYLNIKNSWQLSGKPLAALQKLAAWRLEQARKRNLALNFVVKEPNLLNLAKRQPSNKSELHAVVGLSPQEIRRNGEQILALLNDVTESDYPPRVERLVDFAAYKGIAQSLREMCQQVAENQQIPVEVLGSKKQINQLLQWLWFKLDETREKGLLPDLLSGWRGELLLSGIERVVGAKIALSKDEGCPEAG